jgi:hypothetical protein
MKKEVSSIKILDDKGNLLKRGFHDEFDALEWLEAQGKKGKFKIVTERLISL